MNDILLFFPVGLAPGLFWLWYFYRKDRYEPEPRRLILRTAFLGGLAALAASLLEWPFRGAGFLTAVMVAPVIEELAKFTVVRRTMYNHPEFDEPMDGLVYAAAAALGFASLENAAYVADAHLHGGMEAAAGTFWVRAILSVPGHVLFSACWGAALGNAKFAPPERRNGIIARGLVLAVLGHATWNLLCSIPWTGGWVLCAFAMILWAVLDRNVRNLLGHSPFQPLPVVSLGGATPEQPVEQDREHDRGHARVDPVTLERETHQ